MPPSFTESIVEEAALAWLAELDYTLLGGPRIALGEPMAEREDFRQVVPHGRLRQDLVRLNPTLPTVALDEAFRKLIRPDRPTLVANNHYLHRLLVDGVTVEYQRVDGSLAGAQVQVLDYDFPEHNDWLAVNQLTVVET